MFYPPLLEALRRVTGPTAVDAPDAELLARFVQSRDEAAFAAMVRRHGGLVWGACRRRLRDAHAAEDAFQTTFLALARHAASVRRPDALGGWLHRVAVRCSAGFRPPRESMSPPPTDLPASAPEPATVVAGRELERVIDAEIDRLPEPFRQAFLMCEVEQRTASDAARALGCPVGTIESRLTRARERLRARLARRGITVGALAGLGLAAGSVPASARAGAIALALGSSPVPVGWATLADRAARTVSGLTMTKSLIGTIALVGLGGLVWVLGQGQIARTGGTQATAARIAPDEAIPEPDQFRRNRFNFPLPPEAIARVGDPWLRHGAIPQRIAFSGDARFLAAAGPGDRWLRVWDMSTGRPRTHLALARGEIPVALALSADGGSLKAIVHTGASGKAHLREYDTFRGIEVRRRRAADSIVDTAAFSEDGKLAAVVVGRKIRLIDTAAGVDLWQAEAPTGGRVDLAFSPAGGRIAVVVAGSDRVRLLDQETGRGVGELVDRDAALSMPTFSADGKRLATWCANNQWVRVWDASARRVSTTVSSGYPVAALVLSPNGEHVAVFAGPRSPTLWPAGAGAKKRVLESMGGVCGQFSPDGRLLAVATAYGVVQVFDATTGKFHALSQNQVLAPTPTAFGPDDRLLADGYVRWLEYPSTGDDPPRVFEQGMPLNWFSSGAADSGCMSRDRTLLARFAILNGEKREYAMELLDAATGAQRRLIPVDGITRRPVFSPDGNVLYAICNKQIRGWNVQTGKEIMRGEGGAGDVVSRLLVSSDGRYLATADLVLTDYQRADSVQVWDAATGKVVLSAEAGHGKPYIAFSPDGHRFAAAIVVEDANVRTPEVRVWDVPTQSVVARFPGYDGQPAFSPDGRTVAVTRDEAIVLLETATGKPRHAFQHHGPVAPDLAWRADGRVLAAASLEAPIYLWDVVGDRTASVLEWDAADDDKWWAALTSEDSAEGFQSVRQLWAHPANAVPFLKSRVAEIADARLSARACEVLELIGGVDAKAVLVAWAGGPSDSSRTKEAKDSLRRMPGATK